MRAHLRLRLYVIHFSCLHVTQSIASSADEVELCLFHDAVVHHHPRQRTESYTRSGRRTGVNEPSVGMEVDTSALDVCVRAYAYALPFPRPLFYFFFQLLSFFSGSDNTSEEGEG